MINIRIALISWAIALLSMLTLSYLQHQTASHTITTFNNAYRLVYEGRQIRVLEALYRHLHHIVNHIQPLGLLNHPDFKKIVDEGRVYYRPSFSINTTAQEAFASDKTHELLQMNDFRARLSALLNHEDIFHQALGATAHRLGVEESELHFNSTYDMVKLYIDHPLIVGDESFTLTMMALYVVPVLLLWCSRKHGVQTEQKQLVVIEPGREVDVQPERIQPISFEDEDEDEAACAD